MYSLSSPILPTPFPAILTYRHKVKNMNPKHFHANISRTHCIPWCLSLAPLPQPTNPSCPSSPLFLLGGFPITRNNNTNTYRKQKCGSVFRLWRQYWGQGFDFELIRTFSSGCFVKFLKCLGSRHLQSAKSQFTIWGFQISNNHKKMKNHLGNHSLLRFTSIASWDKGTFLGLDKFQFC